jgi:hypothetical protein
MSSVVNDETLNTIRKFADSILLSCEDAYAFVDAVDAVLDLVERLPKTADGVYVLIGYDSVWLDDRSVWLGPGEIEDWDDNEWLVYIFDKTISECYSTREAAEAARASDG